MTLRKVTITGGPDARDIRVVDADTGLALDSIVKIELLATPGGGALVNITQACRVASINLVARDVGLPLIDLPDDHPEVQAADAVAQAIAFEADVSALEAQLAHATEPARAAAPAQPIEEAQEAPPRTTLAPGTPWPFQTSEERRAAQEGA